MRARLLVVTLCITSSVLGAAAAPSEPAADVSVTTADGGYIYNRMFDDRETWYHRVSYTPTSLLDDKPAIYVDAAPVPGVDNIRRVQPGVYLGITMTAGVQPIWGPNSTWTIAPGTAHAYFVLDFNNTEVTTSECPLCTPHDQAGP